MREMLKSGAAALVAGLVAAGCGSTTTPAASGSSSGTSVGTGSSTGAGGAGASTGGTSGTAATGTQASTGTLPSGGSSTGGVATTGTATTSGSGTSTTGAATTGAATGSTSGATTGATTGAATGSTSGASSGAGGGTCSNATLPIGHPDSTITYPTHAGYTLYLAEEFNNPIDLDNDCYWTWSDGGLDEGSVRFQKQQITFSPTVTDDTGKGYMTITVAGTTAPGSMSYAENKQIGVKPQISGEMRTKYNNYRYGWIEARYKPPPSSEANYISTLFVFRTPKQIAWREIDNELTPNTPNVDGCDVYYQDNNTGGGFNAGFADQMNAPYTGITDDSTAFHTYAIEWQPTFIKWYVDGNMVRVKDATHGKNNVPIPDMSVKLFMNLWIFGTPNGYGGNMPQNNTYPMHAEYDYFRYYKWDMETKYPCGSAAAPYPACADGTAAAHPDNIRSKNNPNDGVTYYAQ